jgi:hypothetical protein
MTPAELALAEVLLNGTAEEVARAEQALEAERQQFFVQEMPPDVSTAYASVYEALLVSRGCPRINLTDDRREAAAWRDPATGAVRPYADWYPPGTGEYVKDGFLPFADTWECRNNLPAVTEEEVKALLPQEMLARTAKAEALGRWPANDRADTWWRDPPGWAKERA